MLMHREWPSWPNIGSRLHEPVCSEKMKVKQRHFRWQLHLELPWMLWRWMFRSKLCPNLRTCKPCWTKLRVLRCLHHLVPWVHFETMPQVLLWGSWGNVGWWWGWYTIRYIYITILYYIVISIYIYSFVLYIYICFKTWFQDARKQKPNRRQSRLQEETMFLRKYQRGRMRFAQRWVFGPKMLICF